MGGGGLSLPVANLEIHTLNPRLSSAKFYYVTPGPMVPNKFNSRLDPRLFHRSY